MWISNPTFPQANKAVAILHIWNASFLIKIIPGNSQTCELKLLASQLKVLPEFLFYFIFLVLGIKD